MQLEVDTLIHCAKSKNDENIKKRLETSIKREINEYEMKNRRNKERVQTRVKHSLQQQQQQRNSLL